MSDKKWAKVMSSVSLLMELQQKQNDLQQEVLEIVEDMVHFLMDEDGQNAEETDTGVLERLQRTVRERRAPETDSEEKTA